MVRSMLWKLSFAALLVSAPFAQAASLRDCNTFEANARNIAWPLETAGRSFANGAINLVNLFLEEPACCGAHLMVTYPQSQSPYEQGCLLISHNQQLGFSGIDVQGAQASYDPSVGLTMHVPATTWDGQQSWQHWLRITVNQATGQIWVVQE